MKLKSRKKTAGIEISPEDINTFLKNVVEPFIVHLRENISSRFASSSDVVSAMSIFDPKKMPSVESLDLHRYGVAYFSLTMGQTNLVRHHLVSQQLRKHIFPLRSTPSGYHIDGLWL